MRSKMTKILTVGAVAGCAALFWYSRPRLTETSDDSALARLESQLSQTTRELDEIRRAAANQQRHLDGLRVARALSSPALVPPEEERATEPQMAAHVEEVAEDRSAAPPPLPTEMPAVTDDQVLLDVAFAEALPDPQWEHEAEPRAEESMKTLLPDGAQLTELKCRGTLCRAEVAHQHGSDHRTLIDTAARTDFDWPGPTVIVREQRGDDVVSIAYFGKVGELMPTP